MEIIDMHTHLYGEPDLEVQFNLGSHDIRPIVEDYVDRLDRLGIDHALAIINDDMFLDETEQIEALFDLQESAGGFSTAFIIEPRRDDATQLVGKVADRGGIGIKLHPYRQGLDEDTYHKVQEVVTTAEREGLVTIIDSSYGGERFYEANGVRLGHRMAGLVDSPVLLAHAGGARILEAFSAAETYENIYLDTSLSIPYWSGSTVERDFAFAMNEMDMNRWFWGSDMPMMNHRESKDSVDKLLERYGLADKRQKLFSENAKQILNL